MLRVKIESDSHTILFQRRAQTQKERIFSIGSLICTSIITFVCYIILVNQSTYFYNSSCLLNMPLLFVDFIAQFIETIIDIFMGIKFVKHFLFFLRIKQLKLKELGLQLSNFNRFMVIWLFFLVISNLLCVLSRLFFMPIIENRVIGN